TVNVWGPVQTLTNEYVDYYGSCTVGCRVNIYYRVKNTCGFWCDIAITKIEVLAPGCPCPLTEIMRNAMAKVLVKGNIPCAPRKEGECSDAFRVTVGGCWRRMTCPGPDPCLDTWIQCDQPTCCIQRYK